MNTLVKTITAAVIGNPNSGKSTLINAIAGTRLRVGNWPGVTVEKRAAEVEHGDAVIRWVDLPGTYSFSPHTQEEIITRDFLVSERPDVVVAVVDATNLERNLYLVVQVLELGVPLIVALNIHDEALKKGYRIDTARMERLLGARVIPTVATKGEGVGKLAQAVVELAKKGARIMQGAPSYGESIESAVREVEGRIRTRYPRQAEQYPLRWTALKVLEGDSRLPGGLQFSENGFLDGKAARRLADGGEDLESSLAEARYAVASRVTRKVLARDSAVRGKDWTERIDRVALHRVFGSPVFLAAMWLVFKLTFDLSTPFVDWVDGVISGPVTRWAGTLLTLLSAPDWLGSLVREGVIAGVGFVLVFVPVIFAMMFFITLLEGSGYMARAAFVMDRAMQGMGLHGRSFIPMLLGFGCNVPAIYATRTLENPRDRHLTSLLIPLMSCGARLPVYAVFVGAFFPSHSGTVLWFLYVLGIALAVLMGILFKHTLFRGESPVFIMELPPYRIPTMKTLLLHTWEKGKHFLFKAGTYILAVSIIVWFLLNLPWGVVNKKDSLLGKAGQVAAPVLAPVGFGTWEAASSLMTGMIAKEIVVGTMSEIYAGEAAPEEAGPVPSFGEDILKIGTSFLAAAGESVKNVFSTFGTASISLEEDNSGLRAVVQEKFTPLSALSFMVFVLLYMPCVIVGVASKQEFGTWKWFWISFVYQGILAWGISFIIYQGGRLLGLGG